MYYWSSIGDSTPQEKINKACNGEKVWYNNNVH